MQEIPQCKCSHSEVLKRETQFNSIAECQQVNCDLKRISFSRSVHQSGDCLILTLSKPGQLMTEWSGVRGEEVRWLRWQQILIKIKVWIDNLNLTDIMHKWQSSSGLLPHLNTVVGRSSSDTDKVYRIKLFINKNYDNKRDGYFNLNQFP